MPASQRVYDTIRKAEGLRLIAYQDDNGVWTIAYGHTKDVMPGLCCTLGQAERWLVDDVTEAEQELDCLLFDSTMGRPSQGVYDAFVDWVFNLGVGHLRTSELWKAYCEGDRDAVNAEWVRWVHSDGHVDGGLVERRATELEWFNEAC